MAYDEVLADRMRALLEGRDDVTEKKMFGGLAFLVGGHLAIAASDQGGVLVRVDPAASDDLVDSTSAEVAVMRGRPMTGWLRVKHESLVDDQELRAWVSRGSAYAGSLPPKRQR